MLDLVGKIRCEVEELQKEIQPQPYICSNTSCQQYNDYQIQIAEKNKILAARIEEKQRFIDLLTTKED